MTFTILRTSETAICLLHQLYFARVMLRAEWSEAERCISDLAQTEHSDDKYV